MFAYECESLKCQNRQLKNEIRDLNDDLKIKNLKIETLIKINNESKNCINYMQRVTKRLEWKCPKKYIRNDQEYVHLKENIEISLKRYEEINESYDLISLMIMPKVIIKQYDDTNIDARDARVLNGRSKRTLLKCEECFKRFSSFYTLIQHMKDDHMIEVTRFNRNIFKKKYNNLLNQNQKKKVDLTSKKQFRNYITPKIVTQTFLRCPNCPYVSRYGLTQLKKHLLTHNKEKPFKCTFCLIPFEKNDKMKEHMNHCVKRPLNLPIKSAINKHNDNNTFKQYYKCPISDCKFQTCMFQLFHKHLMVTHTDSISVSPFKPFTNSTNSMPLVNGNEIAVNNNGILRPALSLSSPLVSSASSVPSVSSTSSVPLVASESSVPSVAPESSVPSVASESSVPSVASESSMTLALLVQSVSSASSLPSSSVSSSKPLYKCYFDKCKFSTNSLDIYDLHIQLHNAMSVTIDKSKLSAAVSAQSVNRNVKVEKDNGVSSVSSALTQTNGTEIRFTDTESQIANTETGFAGTDMPLNRNEIHLNNNGIQLNCNEIPLNRNDIPLLNTEISNSYVQLSNDTEITAKFECSNCEYKPKNLQDLDSHMRSVHASRYYITYKCKQCDAVFKKINILQEHMFLHHNTILNYKCGHENCGKMFKNMDDVKQHLKIDHKYVIKTKKKPKKSVNLLPVSHPIVSIKSNSIGNSIDTKPFQTLSTEFKNQLNRTQNINLMYNVNRQSSQSALFKCSKCEFLFNSKFKLSIHEAMVHPIGPVAYVQCPVCNCKYINDECLSQHIATNHPSFGQRDNESLGTVDKPIEIDDD